MYGIDSSWILKCASDVVNTLNISGFGSDAAGSGSDSAHWYDRRVILLAFLAGLAVVVGGAVVVAVRGLELWRQAKRTGKALTSELATFEERTARTERLLAEADTSSRELQDALERLRVSQARLAVLTGPLDQASARTRWLRSYLPA